MYKDRIVIPARKGLHGLQFVVKNDREFTEWIKTSRIHGIAGFNIRGEFASVRAGDDRIEIRVDDVFVAIEHAQDRPSGQRMRGRAFNPPGVWSGGTVRSRHLRSGCYSG